MKCRQISRCVRNTRTFASGIRSLRFRLFYYVLQQIYFIVVALILCFYFLLFGDEIVLKFYL